MIEPKQGIDSQQQRGTVRVILLALVVSIVFGVASLITDVASFSGHTGPSGKVTTLVFHTRTTRVVLAAATIFEVALVFGIILRSRLAWFAALILPALWTMVCAVMNWSLIIGFAPEWSGAIPIACLVGFSIWNTFVWRRSWKMCEGYFR